MTSLPLRGLNLILLIIAILLCLEGMELGFLAFIILAIALEVIDLLFGIKELRRLWRGVEHCIGVWRAGHEASISQSPPPPRL